MESASGFAKLLHEFDVSAAARQSVLYMSDAT